MKKTFEVDVTSTQDLKKLISYLQNIRKSLIKKKDGYEPINFGVSKHNVNELLDIFNNLFDFKFEKGNYYVYAHCNPNRKISLQRDVREIFAASKLNLSFVPFYIGKGTGERCNDLNRNDAHRKIRTSIRENGSEIVVVKIFDELSESSALKIEQMLIALFGLKSLSNEGYLCNLQTDNSAICELYEKHNSTVYENERLKNKTNKLITKMSKWI